MSRTIWKKELKNILGKSRAGPGQGGQMKPWTLLWEQVVGETKRLVRLNVLFLFCYVYHVFYFIFKTVSMSTRKNELTDKNGYMDIDTRTCVHPAWWGYWSCCLRRLCLLKNAFSCFSGLVWEPFPASPITPARNGKTHLQLRKAMTSKLLYVNSPQKKYSLKRQINTVYLKLFIGWLLNQCLS